MTDTASRPSFVEIAWPFDADPPELYCPRSGKIFLDAEGEVEQPGSPYVTFLYLDLVGDFIYLREDLAERLKDARAALLEEGVEEDDLPSDLEMLEEKVNLGVAPVVFKIATSGRACGPVSSRIIVGFDLWGEADETDE